MNIALQQLVLGVALPAAVSIAIATPVAALKPRGDDRWREAARVLAVTAGVLAAHAALLGVSLWPTGAAERLPAVFAAIGVTEVVLVWVSRRWLGVGLRVGLAAFVLFALVWPVARNWPGGRAALVLAGLGAALSAGPAGFDWLARRRAGAAAPLVLWCVAALAAVALVLSYTAKLGQLAGAAAACVGPMVLLAWWRPGIAWTGAASAGAWVLSCLLIAGNLYSGLLPIRGALLAAAPFALALPLAIPRGARPWTGALVAVLAAAAIAGSAVALAAREYEPAG